MKFKSLILAGVTGLLTFSGCSKFLEEKSQSEVIPKTAIDYRELLIGSGYMNNSEPMNLVYFMDDDVDLFIEYANGQESPVGQYDAKYNYLYYTWQPRLADMNGVGDRISEDPAATPYASYYKWIMGCNAVLENIDQSIGSDKDKDRVKAEALAVRAFYYFRLANLYGEPYNYNPQSLCVPLKLSSGMTDKPLKQHTVQEVYTQVVSDLKEAAAIMDPLPIVRKDYHINQPAIHILLSRVYLYMEKYQEAIDEANKVFDQGGVLTNLTALAANTWLSYANPEVEWLYGGNTQPNQSTYIPSAAFRGSFDPADVRITKGIQVQSNNFVPLVVKLPTGIDLGQTLRTPEALLNRAEAYVQLNKLPEALNDLNSLRRTRIPGYTDVAIADKAALLLAVREERRKEFCFENFRWFDLRRYGMPAISHRYQHEPGEPILEYKLAEKDPAYTLPFATSLLIRNAELKQNPSGMAPDRVGQ
ncbi:RagB/SusD family nutrient uptake outer membrane protein [Chitinophaga sp. sic0106]|uniref:RagB/SusD family nutrient uptake outer membrane protein n=1 Tax=Chitinophaga sp. sic0106 TaxID=2854785 RepID=UPI001C45A99B|nr:RagB/SusD family nutrient uptake outer membrane protein [Chitinophaga sp. sic0106]MBV7530938.1 RagB/SusD family nutrient uptake outer membrane protein [Chitinophaga sp. sic0106]